MSGGVGPPCDISLPKEEPHEPDAFSSAAVKTKSPSRRSFFTFRQLNALAVAVVLSASGMISPENFVFVVFSVFYIYFISRVAFPPTSPRSDDPPPPVVFGDKNRILPVYVFFGSVIGLFLPIAYIFQGIFEGDKEGIKAAVPHVFLLASQVFLEGLTQSGRFSLPVRVLVPVFYNSMRVLTILEWLRSEISKVEVGFGRSARRLMVGRGLAIANMAFWSFNLFGFLLPFYMPKAFKIYYSNSKLKD
ncbi:hypothetical protein ABFS82_06G108100 [Erythranthe guttata]|uniref:DUF7733 domain-containing protein n=1 Tax=Erythranthe guttata TaxID=4155 RepID=A0A022PXK3_ERYGU|nr:PREDICTED: uncharacterized protein LOC105977483 [Erythranthe guttata]EYU19563.1 hypothetical protein MIMGU_mgv1a012558mg [Erythranthe guttata]|eukprot:XP_012858240.1 PREDICTED: uncharacterized protein LOC105977483 [Erythranthe guttata]